MAFAAPALLAAWPLVQQQRESGPPTVETTDAEFESVASELRDEFVLPAVLVGEKGLFLSDPRLVARGSQGAWLVYQEWEPGVGDHLLALALGSDGQPAAGGTGKAAPIDVAGGSHEVLHPSAALDAAGRLVVSWTETTDDGPQLRAARLEGAKFGAPFGIDAKSGATRDGELALHDGRLWCAYVAVAPPAGGSERGNVDVLLAPVEEAGFGAPTRVGDGRFTDLDPVVASDGARIWVAWSQYSGRDYEVMLRSFDPKAGALAPALNVSSEGASDDLHPALAAGAGGELWLAWDRIVDPGRGRSVPRSYDDRYRKEPCGVHVMTACVRDGKVLVPAARRDQPAGVLAGAPRLSWTGGVPSLSLGADGKPWLTYRYLAYGPPGAYGYAVVLHHWDGARWSTPLPVDRAAGAPEAAALLAGPDAALLAWQRDPRIDSRQLFRMPGGRTKVRVAMDAEHIETSGIIGDSTVGIATVPVATVDAGAPKAQPDETGGLVPRPPLLTPPHFHPAADPADDPYVNGTRHFVVAADGKSYRAWFGDLHRHSCVSRCSLGLEERPLQRYEIGRDAHQYDFFALTDHAGQIDPVSWWLEDKLVREQRAPDFCALAGFEWSSPEYGHQNVILPGRLTPVVLPSVRPEVLYQRIAASGAIAIPHGSADQGRSADVSVWDDRLVRLVEVFQAMRGNSEFDGCFEQSRRARVEQCFVQDALNQGREFGLIASTDHGNGCAYAVALAERLDPASLFEAFRARRTYGATTKGMLIDLRVDGHLMGEEVACAAPPRVHLKLRAPADLCDIVIFRDGAIFQRLGRRAQRGDGAIDVTARLDLPVEARAGDEWKLDLEAPGCQMVRSGGSIALHRRNPDPPYAKWRVKDEEATFRWPRTFAPDELDHQYRIDLKGPAAAEVTIRCDGREEKRTLAQWLDAPFVVDTPRGKVSLVLREPPDANLDLEKGLGVKEFEQEWSDDALPAGRHWYYARAITAGGEMVWSSPLFVTRR